MDPSNPPQPPRLTRYLGCHRSIAYCADPAAAIFPQPPCRNTTGTLLPPTPTWTLRPNISPHGVFSILASGYTFFTTRHSVFAEITITACGDVVVAAQAASATTRRA